MGILEKLFGFFSVKYSKIRKIIVVDVGTASLSAALAKKSLSGYVEVVSVLRYPMDLFVSRRVFDNQRSALYIIKKNIAHLMSDAYKVFSDADSAIISVSEPFFQQRYMRKTIQRKHPHERISSKELDEVTAGFIDDVVKDVALPNRLLCVVWSSVRRAWINGYELESPVGYRGAELEVELTAILISAALRDYMNEFLSKWFPRAALHFYTDPQAFQHILSSYFTSSFPALLLDIGGEVTSIIVCSNESQVLCEPVFFGIRTLERRISGLLRCDMEHAKSLLRRYVLQTLDTREVSRVKPLLESSVNEWRLSVAQSFQKAYAGSIRSIFFAGQGRDIPLFRRSVEEHLTGFASSPISLHEFSVPSDQIFPPKILSSGGDNILASLLLYT